MYTPLNIKTDNYLQHSLITVDKLISFALKNNIKCLSITDNNMYGVMDFYKKCKKNNIKPIVGLEIEIDGFKIILYAKNYNGYLNLIKLSTIQSKDNINLNDLNNYSNNLIVIVPYESVSIINDVEKIFNDVYKSYKNDNQKKLLTGKTIYMNEILFLNKNENVYMKHLEAIRDGVTYNFIENNYFDNYLNLSELIINDINNYEIEKKCNLEIPFNLNLMPKYINELNVDSFSYLKKMCINGLKKRFGNTVDISYQQRLKYELSVINKMNFCDYFLIVSDYVNYAKNNNIIVGTGRGSAVGSLVAYCLNITDVDPLKYNLLFERFLNPERISMPDIDIDFEHEKREQVINYCREKYGIKNVAPIIAFGTLGAKQSIRDVARSLNVEIKLVDELCKMLNSNLSLKDNYNKNSQLKEYLDRKKELMNVYRIAMHFEGLKKHITIHAAGIIMANKELDEVIPLASHDNSYLSGYDMTYLEEIGLLKMDFLAIKYLTTIHHIIDSINKNTNNNLNFDEIPYDDKKAIEVFTNANTLGIFQFESSGMINFLSQMQPNCLDDIFAAIALFRPGPMKNIPHYIKRKNNEEKIDYLDDSLKEILKPTYGIMIYQEQIMQIANVMADYTLGEADVLRKAMSKKNKEILLKEKEKFTSRSINKGYDKNLVEKVYELMLKFAEYGFNKSHSVGYSIIACKMAYLKAYYPEYFITELLSMEASNSTKIKQYILEAKKYGIEILPPSINYSNDNYTIDNKNIRYPFSKIKGINNQISNNIITNRNDGLFKNIYDFIKRCYDDKLNKTSLESLIYVGCFDELGYNRYTLIENLDNIINYGELIKSLNEEYVFEPEIVLYDEYSKKELIELEYKYLGVYLTNHPVQEIRNRYNDIVITSEISKHFNKKIKIVVCIDKINEIETKKHEKMAFIVGSDEFSKIDMVLFPKIYNKYKFEKNAILLLEGKVEKRYDEYKLIVDKVLSSTLQ